MPNPSYFAKQATKVAGTLLQPGSTTALAGGRDVFELVAAGILIPVDASGNLVVGSIASNGASAVRVKAIRSTVLYGVTLLADAARTVADGVTATDTSLVSATAAFAASDVGALVVGAGIPYLTYIASVTSATTVVLTQATTATDTAVSVVINSYATTHEVPLTRDVQLLLQRGVLVQA